MCCCCWGAELLFYTSVLVVFTVNNWGLHNSSSPEHCQMFWSCVFIFLVCQLQVSQVMTGLRSGKSERQLCCFWFVLWFICLLPAMTLSFFSNQNMSHLGLWVSKWIIHKKCMYIYIYESLSLYFNLCVCIYTYTINKPKLLLNHSIKNIQ